MMETRSSANDKVNNNGTGLPEADPIGIHEATNSKISEENSSSCSSSYLDENLQWVQCENPNCLKWRSLSNEEVGNLGIEAPWFCYMNKDVLHSSCDDPEEKYTSSWKMKRHGFTYRYSLLPEGSIIWAKLPGYCKWPAVLCSCPTSSDYFILDNDGDPHSYHVEFLGTKHSIAWVHHEKVTAYGNLGKQEALETCSQPLSQVSMNRFRTKTKRRKRSILVPKKKISVQLSEQLQKAIDEADDLIEMEKGDILNSCHYRYRPSQTKPKAHKSDSKAEKRSKEQKSKKKKRKRKHKESNSTETLSNSQLSNHAIDNKLSDFQSKEERLMADIKGLEEREVEFIDDYTKFMKQKGNRLKKPKWFGVSVKLFHLYMAVQERGGFNEVCSNSLWKNIVIECCEITSNKLSSSAASTAMTFYSRRLLPYELHIKASLSKGTDGNEHVIADKLANATVGGSGSGSDQSGFLPSEPTNMEEEEALKELEEIEALLENVNEETVDDDQEIAKSTYEKSQVSGMRMSQKSDSDETQPIASQGRSSEVGKDVIGSSLHPAVASYDLSPSQVFPEAVGEGIASEPEDMLDSDEDLFAEISRDEELLQSFLSAS